MRNFLLTMALVFCMGCIPYSDNPLTAPDAKNIDPSIVGTWFFQDEGESGFIHIGIDEKTRLLRLIMVDIDKEKELDLSEFSGHTSSLEGNHYLNLSWVRPNMDVPGYLFVKYTLDNDRLGLATISSDPIEAAIKGGRLKGRMGDEAGESSLHITEDQKKLQQFVIQHDKELFPETQYLSRVVLPKTTTKQ